MDWGTAAELRATEPSWPTRFPHGVQPFGIGGQTPVGVYFPAIPILESKASRETDFHHDAATCCRRSETTGGGVFRSISVGSAVSVETLFEEETKRCGCIPTVARIATLRLINPFGSTNRGGFTRILKRCRCRV